MSGLYVLALLTIWLGLGYGGYRLWRRFAPQWVQKKRLYAALGLAGAAVWLLWPFYEVAGEKMYYDAQVNRLCAKDGGIKIYETVKLPVERFNQWGQPNFYKPTQRENALGPEYVFRWDLHYILKGNPSLHRSHTQVFRRSDNKLLGEAIDYSRGGGDLPGPWQPSAFTCPETAGHIALLTRIFVKLDKE
jgi:hypothetical protein